MARRRSSRISRLEERRTKRRLALSVFGIITVIALVITLGVPLIVKTSVFLGNINSKEPLSQNGDKTPPVPPTLESVPAATNSARLKVAGYGEPETNLTLFVNGDEIKKILLASDGTFTFHDITLAEGENLIYAVSTDDAGNKSSPSKELTVLYKNKPPKLKVTEPEDGQEFTNNNNVITIKGVTDPDVELRVNGRFASINDKGEFSFPYKLVEGDNAIVIVAIDKAGNETRQERKVFYNP